MPNESESNKRPLNEGAGARSINRQPSVNQRNNGARKPNVPPPHPPKR